MDEAGVDAVGVVGGADECVMVEKGEGEGDRPMRREFRRAEKVPVSMLMIEARRRPGSGTTREERREPASGSRIESVSAVESRSLP